MKLTSDEIFFINMLYSISGAQARDCLIGDNVVSFLVRKKDVGKAIGKKAENIKKLSKKTKKHIEIMEHCSDVIPFLRKAFYKIKTQRISKTENDGKTIVTVSLDSENRKKMLNNIGRIKRIKEFAKRNYKVDDIKIK